MRVIDLTGRRFSRLVVAGRVGSQSGQAVWGCICDCGNKTRVLGANLRTGSTQSCGCGRIEKATKHGHSRRQHRTPTYWSWRGMRARCTQQGFKQFSDYGGRGIAVCDRWRDSFESFLADMGERPDGRTLDRIDNDGNYEPGNCRWATPKEQRANRRAAA